MLIQAKDSAKPMLNKIAVESLQCRNDSGHVKRGIYLASLCPFLEVG